MVIFKFFILLLLSLNIYANSLDKIIYVENKDQNEISLKDEFFNDKSTKYTLTVGVIKTDKHSPIAFFKRNKLTNAVAYRFGKNLEYTRIISGLYENHREAKLAINNLESSVIRNNPYPTKLERHQKQFRTYNEKNIPIPKSVPQKNINNTKEAKGSIFISGSENSQKLKEELLKNSSRAYSISIATLSSSNKTIKNFFKANNISDKALAHVYGKKKDKVRVIYGLYGSYGEAKQAIAKLNRDLKKNKPYAMRMKNFQSFYKKHNPTNANETIVPLKINDKKDEEKVAKPKLKDEIKIVQPKAPVKKRIQKNEPKLRKTKVLRESPKKKIKPKIKKAKKITRPKVVKKRDENKNRYLKHSKLIDVYYVESDGSFNILNEVFLNDGSSFFTIDLGEIKLSDKSIEQFFLENNLHDNALAYKYGDKKEFARAVYGAYETKDAANDAIKKLNVEAKNLRVSNIKNHQKLFKTYHDNILKRGPISKPKKSSPKKTVPKKYYKTKPSNDDIIYVDLKNSKSLKDEFFKKNSPFYTITLITFHKNDSTIEKFIESNYIQDDMLAFSLGSKNDYYRIIYGLYSSSKEAIEAISNLDDNLLKNKPYVSKVKTTRKRFESYNNRNLSSYKKLATKIELK